MYVPSDASMLPNIPFGPVMLNLTAARLARLT